MKIIVCYRCKKSVEVPEDWTFGACPLCKTKEKARGHVQKEKRRLDREARNKIKELRLEGKTLSFSEWANLSKEKLNNPHPTWEQYLEYLKQRSEHQIFDRADRETFRLKVENQKKYQLIREDLFPFKHERECYAFRLSRLNGSEDVRHLSTCPDCSDWNYNFINDMLEKSTDNEDFSEKIDPIEKWEFEQHLKRGGTLPDHSLDRFKPKPQLEENPSPDKIRYEPLEQQEPHSEPPEQPDPTSSKNDVNYILSEHDRKKKEQSETDNQ